MSNYILFLILLGLGLSCGVHVGSVPADDKGGSADDNGVHAADKGGNADYKGENAEDVGVHAEDDGVHAEDDGVHAEDKGLHAGDDGVHANDDGGHADNTGIRAKPKKCKKLNMIKYFGCKKAVCKKIPGGGAGYEDCPQPAIKADLVPLATKAEVEKNHDNIMALLNATKAEVDKILGLLKLSGAVLHVVFKKDLQFPITKNNQLGVLPYLGRTYEITFELFLNTVSSSASHLSFLHFTTDKDCCGYGDRTPALWTHSNNKFHVASAINGIGSYSNDFSYQLTTQKWYNFKISQFLNSYGEYVFSVKIDGTLNWDPTNTQPTNFKNVKIFACDPWYNAVDGSMRRLIVKTLNN